MRESAHKVFGGNELTRLVQARKLPRLDWQSDKRNLAVARLVVNCSNKLRPCRL